MSPTLAIAPWQGEAAAAVGFLFASARLVRRRDAGRMAAGMAAALFVVGCAATLAAARTADMGRGKEAEIALAQTGRDFDPGAVFAALAENSIGGVWDGAVGSIGRHPDVGGAPAAVRPASGQPEMAEGRATGDGQPPRPPAPEPGSNKRPGAEAQGKDAPWGKVSVAMPVVLTCGDDPSIDGCYNGNVVGLGKFECGKTEHAVAVETLASGIRQRMGVRGRKALGRSVAVEVIGADVDPGRLRSDMATDIASVDPQGHIRITARSLAPRAAPPRAGSSSIVMRSGEFERMGIDDRCTFSDGSDPTSK